MESMDNINYEISYLGDLRTESIHLKSSSRIDTDAPTDNNGKGERFSPTDLVATALVTCILTVWGIHYQKSGKDLKRITSRVQKIMSANPRRIVEIKIVFDFGTNLLSKEEFKTLDHLAAHCPVANCLDRELKVTTNLADFY